MGMNADIRRLQSQLEYVHQNIVEFLLLMNTIPVRTKRCIEHRKWEFFVDILYCPMEHT